MKRIFFFAFFFFLLLTTYYQLPTSSVHAENFSVTLYHDKWNLVSIPFDLSGQTLGSLNSALVEGTYQAYEWNAQRQEFIETSRIGPRSVVVIYPYLENDLTISVSGTAPGETSYSLVKGWNLIGYYGNSRPGGEGIIRNYHCPEAEGKRNKCALASLVEPVGDGNPRWSALFTYCEAENPNQWIGIDPNTNQRMTPGAGYWIFMVSSAANINQDYLYAPSTCSGI